VDRGALLLLLGSLMAFFTGVGTAVMVLAGATFGRIGVSRGLTSITTVYCAGDEDHQVSRVGRWSEVMARLAVTVTPRPLRAKVRRRLDLAGNPPYWTETRMFAVKGFGLVGLGPLGLIIGLAAGGGSGALAGVALGAMAGFLIPDLVLYDGSERRQDLIRRTMPDILDTLTVSVEAGLGFDAALGQITRYGRGPLAGEFARVLQEMRIGRSRVAALRALGRRTTVVELRSFCAIVVQANELGVPIANVLREQAKQMRVRRRQRAEELAQKVPVKILFPLVFCLFPAIFVVVLGPGLINMLEVFGR
jgi:tight adherence protein C